MDSFESVLAGHDGEGLSAVFAFVAALFDRDDVDIVEQVKKRFGDGFLFVF